MRQGWARRFATGLPCRARCAVSSLRAGIPRASIRFAHSALRLAGGSLRSPPSAGPIRPWPRSTAPAASPPCPPRHGAARRARRGAGFASLAPSAVRRRCRLRRAPRCTPRRAVVPAQVRTLPPASSAARFARLPSGVSPRSDRHSSATAAPTSAGFAGVDSPIAHTADLAVPYRRGGLGFHTPRSSLQVHASGAHGVPFRALPAPFGAWVLLDRAHALEHPRQPTVST